MNTVGARIRKMLAASLSVQEQTLDDEFCWLRAMGIKDAEYFLADVNAAFSSLPSGLSVGGGKHLFKHVSAEMLEQIATVGGLIAYTEKHVKAD